MRHKSGARTWKLPVPFPFPFLFFWAAEISRKQLDTHQINKNGPHACTRPWLIAMNLNLNLPCLGFPEDIDARKNIVAFMAVSWRVSTISLVFLFCLLFQVGSQFWETSHFSPIVALDNRRPRSYEEDKATDTSVGRFIVASVGVSI